MNILIKGKLQYTLILLIILLSFTFLIPALPLTDPLSISLTQRLQPPSFQYPFGTDDLGRDIFSRSLHGFALTVKVSILALLSSLMIGVFFGGIAGYLYDTWVDKIFNWIISLIFSLPFLLVMASIMSLMEPNIFNAYLILTLIMWVNPARIVRAEVIKTVNLPYIIALRAYGASEPFIFFMEFYLFAYNLPLFFQSVIFQK